MSNIKNSLDRSNLSIAVDKLLEKRVVFDNRLNWIEEKATVKLDYARHTATRRQDREIKIVYGRRHFRKLFLCLNHSNNRVYLWTAYK